MKRRQFIAGLASAAAWPAHAHAQQASKVWLIGFLGPAPATASALPVEALRTGLRELGTSRAKTRSLCFAGRKVRRRCPNSRRTWSAPTCRSSASKYQLVINQRLPTFLASQSPTRLARADEVIE